MSLSPANLEVLRGVRAGIVARGALLQFSVQELVDIHQAEDELDAKTYAAWAGRRMVRSMSVSQHDLIGAREFYEMKLRKGYLVKMEHVAEAFRVAVIFAGRKHHGEEE